MKEKRGIKIPLEPFEKGRTRIKSDKKRGAQ
jgi:hypothetical protein